MKIIKEMKIDYAIIIPKIKTQIRTIDL